MAVGSAALGAKGAPGPALGRDAPPELSDTPESEGTFVLIILFTVINPCAIVVAAAIKEKGAG